MALPQLNPLKNLYKKLIKRFLPLLLGVIASVGILLLWQQLAISEQLHIERLIQQEANGIESELSKELSTRMLALRQMANRWEMSGGTPQALWEADAAAYIKNFYGCQALQWVDPSFKVRWIVPLVGNEAAQNLDLSREPRRQITLQVARDLHQLILTRNILLIQGDQGFLATVPLFVGNQFDGFILGVFRFKTLFDSILRVPPGYKVAIYDRAESIYNQGVPSQSSLHKTVVVRAYGADWRVEVFPTPALIAEVKSSLPIVVLFGGLILVWLFVLVVHLAQVSYRQIHQLEKANHQLQWEIEQRQQAEITIARLAAIVESSEDAIFSKNLGGMITSWNAGAAQIFGYTAAEMIGQCGAKLIPVDYQDQENQILHRIQRGEHIKHYDTKRIGKDGSLIDVSISVSPIKDETGNIIGASKIARNIADRKQAEEALRQSEARYRQLIDNLNAGFVIHATDSSILFCNSTASDLLGLSMNQIIGKIAIDPTWHFVREDGTVMPPAEYPVNQVLSTKIPIKNYVLGINKGIHPLVWVLVNAYPEFDPTGQLKQVVITFINISDRKQAEEEIQQTRNFLQALLDHLPVAVFVKDAHPEKFGVFQFWNKTSERLFGISAEQTIGKTDYDFFPTEQANFFLKKDREVFVKNSAEDIEEIIDSHSLGKRWLHTVKVPIYDEQHQPKYLLGFSEDITDRKQAEAELREMSEVMKNAVSGISKLDTQGRYLYVNKAYADITGYQPEEMIGMPWQNTVYPDELEKLIAIYWQMVEEGRVEVETKGIRKDGSIFYKQLVMIATYDEQHQLLGHYCFMKNISDRKQAEEALRYQKEMFQTIVDRIPVMIALFNPQGRIEFINPEIEQILGWSMEDWQQKDLLSECYPDPVYRQSILKHMLSATGKWQDVTTLTATGEQLQTTWANVRLSSGSFLGIGQDISDRKQKELALRHAMEAAEAANLAKSIFLANMSHELRTPLNVILGFTQVMARDSSLTPSQQQDLQTIRRSGDHLLSLINDILDLSKIESGHCTIEDKGFDLIALLHSLRNMLAERASSKGLDLYFEIGPAVPQFILADAQKLRQILINLLSNGIKFTDRGTISLSVKTLATDPDAAVTGKYLLQFAVTDTGVGIAPEELDTIFDAFVQAQAGKKSANGTGLGLTISRKLVQLMGGEISVSSTFGQGTTFTFTLPVTETSGVNITLEQNDRLVIGLAPGQPHHRILVVDDRVENRQLMVKLLAQLGLEVKEATNGQEAVQIWREWQPELTWMDIRMPVLDGYEATKQIRAMEASQTSIIIALTAQASQSDRTLALAAGCNDYISKPFREQTLFLKMTQYLGLEYIYSESNASVDNQPVPSSSSKEDLLGSLDLTSLATSSKAWLSELENAAVCGDDAAISELVAQLPPEFTQLATYLSDLTNQYQFEQIIRLVQQISLAPTS